MIWCDYTARITDTFKASKAVLLIADVQVSFCSATGATAGRHANIQMQALPAKINAFAAYFRDLGGLPIYIRSTAEERSSAVDKWLNALRGVSRPTRKDNSEQDFYLLATPDDAIIVEKSSGG